MHTRVIGHGLVCIEHCQCALHYPNYQLTPSSLPQFINQINERTPGVQRVNCKFIDRYRVDIEIQELNLSHSITQASNGCGERAGENRV